MTFKRTFTLLPYWKEWLEKVMEKRKDKNTETEKLEIDGVVYGFGGQSITIPTKAIQKFIKEDLNSLYHRSGIGLKVFYKHGTALTEDMSNLQWGEHFNLIITCKTQNILSIDGITTRIYDLVFLRDKHIKYAAQVVEYIDGITGEGQNIDKLRDSCNNRWIVLNDIVSSNFVSGKFVDCGRFSFAMEYKEKLRDKINHILGFGDPNTSYQDVPALQIKGKRDVLYRAEIFRKSFEEDKKYIPKDFTVIDYGCNAGFFLQQAFDWGAIYGIGVEKRELKDIILELCYYLRYFNVDILRQLPNEEFDVAFFLSMAQHVDFEQFVPCIGKILYFEGNNSDHPEEYIKMLEKHFSDIKVLGKTTDFGERILIRAIK